MSFILDALKKSEAERNRQSGPTLIDMRVAAPRRRSPVWMMALLVVLLANLVVLGIVLWRSPAPTAATPPPPVAAPVAPVAPPANVLPPPVLPAESGPAAAALPEPRMPPPEVMRAPPEPAPPAPQRQSPPVTAEDPAQVAAEAGLPSVSDLQLSGTALPELRLALHVYDRNPASRYVLLNSQRMREGDSTADGVVLERITEAGAVLSWRGQRFRIVAGQ